MKRWEHRGFLRQRNDDTITMDAGQNPRKVQYRVEADGSRRLQVIILREHRLLGCNKPRLVMQDINSKGNSGAG